MLADAYYVIRCVQGMLSIATIIALLLPLVSFEVEGKKAVAVFLLICFQAAKGLYVTNRSETVLGFDGGIMDAAYVFELVIAFSVLVSMFIKGLVDESYALTYNNSRWYTDLSLTIQFSLINSEFFAIMGLCAPCIVGGISL